MAVRVVWFLTKVLAVCGICALVSQAAAAPPHGSDGGHAGPAASVISAHPASSAGAGHSLVPRYALVGEGRVETMWQRPRGTPRGLFFMAHGCNHQGTDFFSNVGLDGYVLTECGTSNFGKCLGLPEEVRLRQVARSRGYVAMSVSGGSGSQSCWSMARDAARVREAVEFVLRAEGLPADAPVLATGASSGGGFMGQLALPVDKGGLPNLRCIVPQIMPLRKVPVERDVPTLYVHMPRDTRTASGVRRNMLLLKRSGKRVAEIKVHPVPVTAGLLRPCLGPELAQAAVASLHAAGGVLDDAGMLLEDARGRNWVPAVQSAIQGKSADSLEPDESCVAEAMNVAWAMHEMTSQFADKYFDFCEGK